MNVYFVLPPPPPQTTISVCLCFVTLEMSEYLIFSFRIRFVSACQPQFSQPVVLQHSSICVCEFEGDSETVLGHLMFSAFLSGLIGCMSLFLHLSGYTGVLFAITNPCDAKRKEESEKPSRGTLKRKHNSEEQTS